MTALLPLVLLLVLCLTLFVGIQIGRHGHRPRIIVTDRRDDYHACIEGQPGAWGCGSVPYAAIGNLVNAHREEFGVEVEWRIGPE